MRRDIVVVAALLCAATASAQGTRDWSTVETALGRKGVAQAGGITRFNFPRSDLTVTAKGITLKPAFALGGWVAFKESKDGQVIAMGDLVLTDDEVPAVMRALQAGGIEQSALHNHVLNESPHVMYMHIAAHGDPAAIAKTLATALGTSHTPMSAPPPAASPANLELDTAGIAKTLGVSGRLNGAVYQVSVPRPERIVEMGEEIPPTMGLATAINFQPTGGGKAAITGDFVLRGSEVNPVIRALQANGINPTGLHSHLIDEEPRLYFMHFWAVDDAVNLAKGLRAALDQVAKK